MTWLPDSVLPGLLVRPLLAADLPAVLEVDRTTHGAPHWTLKDYQACLAGPEDNLERRAWVAQSGEGILGFAVVRGVAVGPLLECELEALVVRPQAQRRGVGSALLATVIRELKTAGASILILEVRRSNLAATRLYEAFEFTRAGVREAYYGGIPPEDAVLMQLRLEMYSASGGYR